MGYRDIPGFEDLYLEDSWVLAIDHDRASLAFLADLVLREAHPEHRPPRPGEQYCYRRGAIRFDDVTGLSWTGAGAPPALDGSGTTDLGSFDAFDVADDHVVIVGDFGRIEVNASAPYVELGPLGEASPRGCSVRCLAGPASGRRGRTETVPSRPVPAPTRPRARPFRAYGRRRRHT